MDTSFPSSSDSHHTKTTSASESILILKEYPLTLPKLYPKQKDVKHEEHDISVNSSLAHATPPSCQQPGWDDSLERFKKFCSWVHCQNTTRRESVGQTAVRQPEEGAELRKASQTRSADPQCSQRYSRTRALSTRPNNIRLDLL
ncbi:MAG: hypothetical protein ACOYK6_06255 [Chthoniobacterales bacterium]